MRPISEYPGKSEQAKAIMLMIQNNLDYAVAQHPHELITYGGNGAVFQNWAQYLNHEIFGRNDRRTNTSHVLGHPMGLFPSHKKRQELWLLMEWLSQIIPNQTTGKNERIRCFAIRTNDSWKLYVYWSTRNCSRYNNYSFKRI